MLTRKLFETTITTLVLIVDGCAIATKIQYNADLIYSFFVSNSIEKSPRSFCTVLFMRVKTARVPKPKLSCTVCVTHGRVNQFLTWLSVVVKYRSCISIWSRIGPVGIREVKWDFFDAPPCQRAAVKCAIRKNSALVFILPLASLFVSFGAETQPREQISCEFLESHFLNS